MMSKPRGNHVLGFSACPSFFECRKACLNAHRPAVDIFHYSSRDKEEGDAGLRRIEARQPYNGTPVRTRRLTG